MSAAFDPAGTRIAASDWTTGKAVIIDVAGGKVAGEVELRGRPAGVAWSPDGSRLYVAECDGGAVAEIDPAAMKVARRLAVGLRPAGIAIAPSGKVLLAANGDSHSVSIVEIESGKELKRIPAEREPFAISITADGKSAIVSNLLPATRATDIDHAAALTVIDLEKLEKAGCVRLPPGSTDVRQTATSPDGKVLYVARFSGGSILRVRLDDLAVETFWPADGGAKRSLALDASRGRLYATDMDRGSLFVLDLGTGRLVAEVPLGWNPNGLALSPDGSRVYACTRGPNGAEGYERPGPLAGELVAVDAESLAVVGRQWGGNQPTGLAVAPDGKRLVFTDFLDRRVEAYDTDMRER
ncbi:MAG TPA: SMP-30/gluconolactonase/LRE family protein [Spirochaetales bacterium]|nr:SMP-30/gluconolactonase/LRE family protein [Spirochaetales bacterium]